MFWHLVRKHVVECYIQCNLSAVQAAEEYFERYYEHHQISLPTERPKYTSNQMNEVAETNALTCLFQNPSVSIRLPATDADTSQHIMV